jgi:hypothetical protein
LAVNVNDVVFAPIAAIARLDVGAHTPIRQVNSI